MKVQSAIQGTDRARNGRSTYISGETALLASSVALAFTFVIACLFMLG